MMLGSIAAAGMPTNRCSASCHSLGHSLPANKRSLSKLDEETHLPKSIKHEQANTHSNLKRQSIKDS